MGDAGNMGGLSPTIMTLSGTQTVTGTKTFSSTPVFDNYEDSKVITAPSAAGTGYTRRYSKQVDSNNDSLCIKRKINGAVVEVQL